MSVKQENQLPLSNKLLYLTAVLLEFLDKDKQLIPNTYASGFIRQEADNLYLYTCWHVVTGYNPDDIKTSNSLPNRRYLKVTTTLNENVGGLNRLGGFFDFTLDLYDHQSLPLWLQDPKKKDCFELEAINLQVPEVYDVVKIKIPEHLHEKISVNQYITEHQSLTMHQDEPSIYIGEKLIIVGFPFGFSASDRSPTAVALTRFSATSNLPVFHVPILIDGIGAPGMSGAPVFIERQGNLKLCGIYCGSIHPDHRSSNGPCIRVTDLGKMYNLSMVFTEYWPLERRYFQPD